MWEGDSARWARRHATSICEAGETFPLLPPTPHLHPPQNSPSLSQARRWNRWWLMTPDRVGEGAGGGGGCRYCQLLLLVLLTRTLRCAAGTRPVAVPPTCSPPSTISPRVPPQTHSATLSSATLQAPWMPPRPGFHGSPGCHGASQIWVQ